MSLILFLQPGGAEASALLGREETCKSALVIFKISDSGDKCKINIKPQ
ncbi:hypothetical protein [Spiroplasma endosymbiont of Polydrusus formosus]